MRMSTSLRVASGATVLLFAGHSAGGLGSWSPLGTTTVLEAMKSFHFQVNGFGRSYWHFYIGFGLVISVYLLGQAVLPVATRVVGEGDLVKTRPFIAVFFAMAVLTTILDWMFFFVPPLVLSTVIAVFLGLARVRVLKRSNGRAQSALDASLQSTEVAREGATSERGTSGSVCAGNPIVDMIRGYMPRPSSRLQEFARIGATARIKELQSEIAAIRRDFPALGAPGGERTMPSPSRKRPGRPAANLAAKVPSPGRRRRKMSAEARKKISEAQKKRWAAQKAKK